MAAPNTAGLAPHWLALRDSPVRVSAQDRAKAREAWRAAAEAYARSTHRVAVSDCNDDATTATAPLRNPGALPG